jgi:Ni,Fe-hydrogenase I small subunit
MECLSNKSKIQNTFSSVRDFSYSEKRNLMSENELNNAFLDAMLDLKSSIKNKTKRIFEVNDNIEKLTWFNDLDDECLMLTNDLISAAKDLHSSLVRQYISLDFLRKKGVAKEEIKEFKTSIDELKETYQDLESVFFYLPEMPEFVETTKQLSLV